MKTVVNNTSTPIKISLPGGKTLRLGPGKSGQIRDQDEEHPSVKKLVEAGDIEVKQGEWHASGSSASSTAPHQAGRAGGGKTTFRQRKGDR